MWFRNLQIYQLTERFTLSAEELHEAFSQQQFNPCRGLDTHRIGWVPPLGKFGDQLVHTTNGKMMLCMRREDRILPASVIREAVQVKVDQIESSQHRRVGRKEKSDLRDEATVDLLPRAFTRSTLNFAYIDPRNDWVILDCSSASKAEEILGLVRESLGSFKIKPLTVNTSPSAIMTKWLQKDLPANLYASDECELKEPVEKGGVVRIRGVDLGSEEVLQHLKSGKQVSRLAIQWQDRLSCILADDLSMKRVKFSDLVLDQVAESDEDEVTRFDADFAIMALELENFIPALCHHFGGMDKS